MHRITFIVSDLGNGENWNDYNIDVRNVWLFADDILKCWGPEVPVGNKTAVGQVGIQKATDHYRRLNQWEPRPFFCLLLRVSSGCARPITGQVTSVIWPVIGWAQSELTLSKRQKTGPGSLTKNHQVWHLNELMSSDVSQLGVVY